jgi:hypothetical protein
LGLGISIPALSK